MSARAGIPESIPTAYRGECLHFCNTISHICRLPSVRCSENRRLVALGYQLMPNPPGSNCFFFRRKTLNKFCTKKRFRDASVCEGRRTRLFPRDSTRPTCDCCRRVGSPPSLPPHIVHPSLSRCQVACHMRHRPPTDCPSMHMCVAFGRRRFLNPFCRRLPTGPQQCVS